MICVTAMPLRMSPAFSNQSMIFSKSEVTHGQEIMSFNSFHAYSSDAFGPFPSNHGLPLQTPALETGLDFSPTTPVSMDFVIPSQPTFINNFDMQSPIPEVKVLQFQSPISDYNPYFPVDDPSTENMTCLMQYNDFKSVSTNPSRTTACRASIGSSIQYLTPEPAMASAALQRIQSDSEAVRQTQRPMKRELTSSRLNRLAVPNNIRRQPTSYKKCLFNGCVKKFKRQEHLKRHERVHNPDPTRDTLPCEFCNKIFNRGDNLKSHILLHSYPKKSQTRTKYFSGALAVYNSLNKKPRKTKNEVEMEDTEMEASR